MLPRGTLASAPHARTAHGRSAVWPRSLSDYVLPCGLDGLRQKSADRYTPGPAIVHAIVLCCLPAIRRFCRARRACTCAMCVASRRLSRGSRTRTRRSTDRSIKL